MTEMTKIGSKFNNESKSNNGSKPKMEWNKQYRLKSRFEGGENSTPSLLHFPNRIDDAKR